MHWGHGGMPSAILFNRLNLLLDPAIKLFMPATAPDLSQEPWRTMPLACLAT